MGLISKFGFMSKTAFCMLLIVSYFGAVEKVKESSHDDVYVGMAQVWSAFLTLNFLCDIYSMNEEYYVFKALRNNVKAHGRRRVVLYGVSVFLFAYLAVQVADKITVSSWNTVSDEVLGRFQDNIVRVEEDRVIFHQTMAHPITQGERDPRVFERFFRYPMEDVKMKCTTRLPWISGGSLFEDQIIWHLNGVPVKLTDRHFHKVELREIPEDTSILNKLLRENGISMYEINATLTIHLLKESDFGSYTCHVARWVKTAVVDHVQKEYAAKERRKAATECPSTQNRKEKEEPNWEEEEREYCKCSHLPDLQYLFQDIYTWKGEFRLIPLTKRQQIFKLPPGSILSFTTSYWHYSRGEDIEIDYSVNEGSYLELCSGVFRGCSKLLMIYWLFGNEIGSRFGIPPFELFTIWKKPAFPAKEYEQVHCLCENSYGYHSVRYHRRYYNRTTQRYELIEIPHPHELVVVPREQDMLNLFTNRSTDKYNPESVRKPKMRQPCSWLDDFDLVKDFAVTAVNYFRWTELAFFAAASIIALITLWNIRKMLSFAGRWIRQLVLEGSFAFYTTAVLSTGRVQQLDVVENNNLGSFHVFLSYSDDENDVRVVAESVTPFLEEQGLRVCLRNRDLPPNLPELPALSKGVSCSEKIVFFLSKAFFQDRFHHDFEAAVILETLCNKAKEPGQVLVVKLDDCDVPPWLAVFPVHDWSKNLTPRENSLKLLKWLASSKRTRLGYVLDSLLTSAPVLITCVLLLMSSYSSLLFARATEK